MRRLRLSPWKPSLQWGDEGWRRGGESPLGTRMSSSLQLVCVRNRNLSLAHSSPSIQVGKPVSEPPEIPGIPSMGIESTLFWLHFWKAFISQVFGSGDGGMHLVLSPAKCVTETKRGTIACAQEGALTACPALRSPPLGAAPAQCSGEERVLNTPVTGEDPTPQGRAHATELRKSTGDSQ